MKAPPVDFVRASSLPEALALLAQGGEDALLLAGGQSLIPALNARLSHPALLVDINALEELRPIALRGERLRLGALARHGDILRSPLVREHARLLAEAAPFIAHPAIRNRGTIGGSVALADPAAEWPACLVALDAEIVIAGPLGERRAKADDFFQGLFAVDLAFGEMVCAIEVPVARPRERFAFDELARRRGDYALAGVAGVLRETLDGPLSLRLAFFGVGERPCLAVRDAKTARALAAADGLAALAADVTEGLAPETDAQASGAFRAHLARVLAARVLGRLLEGTA